MKYLQTRNGRVVKSTRFCHAGGRGFESRHSRHFRKENERFRNSNLSIALAIRDRGTNGVPAGININPSKSLWINNRRANFPACKRYFETQTWTLSVRNDALNSSHDFRSKSLVIIDVRCFAYR